MPSSNGNGSSQIGATNDQSRTERGSAEMAYARGIGPDAAKRQKGDWCGCPLGSNSHTNMIVTWRMCLSGRRRASRSISTTLCSRPAMPCQRRRGSFQTGSQILDRINKMARMIRARSGFCQFCSFCLKQTPPIGWILRQGGGRVVDFTTDLLVRKAAVNNFSGLFLI